jgi:uncharacterized membrane protein YcaP (DUF421 family)
MENMFFDTWEGFLRTLIMTVLGYFSMVFILRASGKRTLSKMNAFDFVVTVALGSSLATVALNNSISLVNGVLVFSLFIFLQYLISWLSVRVSSIKKIITSQPALLLYKGEVMEEVMKKERITIEELYMAAREKGISELEKIDLVVLETTGNLTIIPSMPTHKAETMQDVEHYHPAQV